MHWQVTHDPCYPHIIATTFKHCDTRGPGDERHTGPGWRATHGARVTSKQNNVCRYDASVIWTRGWWEVRRFHTIIMTTDTITHHTRSNRIPLQSLTIKNILLQTNKNRFCQSSLLLLLLLYNNWISRENDTKTLNLPIELLSLLYKSHRP